MENTTLLITDTEFCSLCIRARFPKESAEFLTEDYKKILSYETAVDHLSKSLFDYNRDERGDFYRGQEQFISICSPLGIHEYSLQMIFYIVHLPILEALYKKKGFDEKMFEGVLAGIKCKLDECINVYGIHGSFVAVWFSRFFNFNLFPIKRLEFAPLSCPIDMIEKGIYKNDPLIDVHVPSRGRLDKNEVAESYRSAMEFFNNYYNKKHKGFFCESWLIFEKNREIIPECKNIMSFMDDYVIYKNEDDNGDMWRIFGSSALSYPGLPLKKDTYMQKSFSRYIENGGNMGLGFGIYPYEL